LKHVLAAVEVALLEIQQTPIFLAKFLVVQGFRLRPIVLVVIQERVDSPTQVAEAELRPLLLKVRAALESSLSGIKLIRVFVRQRQQQAAELLPSNSLHQCKLQTA
jgi:hypothetical protein